MSFDGQPAQTMKPSTLSASGQRFGHGFLQLLHAFQALHRDPLAWRRYLRVCAFQALATLLLASLSLSTARHSSEGLREERVRKAVEQAHAVAPPVTAKKPRRQLTPKAPPTAPAPHPASLEPRPALPAVAAPVPPTAPSEAVAGDDAQQAAAQAAKEAEEEAKADAQERADTKAEFDDGMHELETSIAELVEQSGATAVRRDKDFQESRKKLDETLTDLEKVAQKLELTDEEKEQLVHLGAQLDVLEAKTKPGWWDSVWALVLSVYGALSLTQAVVVALSRDYHAAISRDASLLLGVAPEDPPSTPRIRLNIPWLRRKFRQRTRSLFVFLPGVVLISIFAFLLPGRALVSSILTSLWAAYWWVVWTASKSARAWEREGVAGPPWFLRLWHNHVASLPLLGPLARAWERLWMRLTRTTYSPAEAVEAQPVEFAGLAAARALQLIPVVKLFVRPLVPVAAAQLLAQRSSRADRLLNSPLERATLAAQRAAVPASPGAIEARDEM